MRPREVHAAGLATVALPPQAGRAGIAAADALLRSDVGQALVDGLRERVPVRQDALAAHRGIVQHHNRVSHAAYGVVQVREVNAASQRVRVIGAEDLT